GLLSNRTHQFETDALDSPMPSGCEGFCVGCCFYLGAATEENSNQEQDDKGAQGGCRPEGLPVAGYNGSDGAGKIVDRSTGNQRADQHSHSIGQESNQSLR